MPFTLTSSRYSFIRPLFPGDEETRCVDNPATVCLPVYALSDIQFQVLLYVDGFEKSIFELTYMGTTTTVAAGVSTSCAEVVPTPAQPVHFIAEWTKIVEGDGPEADVWVGNFFFNPDQEWDTPVGGCFNLSFYVYQSGGTGLATTYLTCADKCFQRIEDKCYTSLFKYRCNEDSFEFRYAEFPEYYNAIRLNCYPRNMQLPSEEKSYVKSNGIAIKLMERIEEEYDLVVDFAPKAIHQKIKVLLAHDLITLSNANETKEAPWAISCTEPYELDWPEFPSVNATASTKIKRNDSLIRSNSNCA